MSPVVALDSRGAAHVRNAPAPRPAPSPPIPANNGHGDVRKKIVPIVRPPAGPSTTEWEKGTYLSLQEWLDAPQAGGAILLQPADDARLLEGKLDGVVLIAVDFHRIGDGRGYTHAFFLRQRLGYSGQLRALGAVTVDQVFALSRVGFDSFALRADQDPEGAVAALKTFSVNYQSTPEVAGALQDRDGANFTARVRLLERALTDIAARHDRPALSSSLSAEDMVIIDTIARLKVPIDVFTLDTGRLHPETMALVDEVKARYGIEIKVIRPDDAAVAEFVSTHGRDGFYDGVAQRKLCCSIRKVIPLARALEGRDAWITGQRREQGVTRATLAEAERDTERNMEKYNPLAAWSWADVLAYAGRFDIPMNPLYARGYVSIGCEPCTKAIRPGEDPRAGRWWWENEDNRECGLHTTKAPTSAEQPTQVAPQLKATRLERLEAEAVYILRELAVFARPALMFSGGKDSAVLLHLALKAFAPQKPPFKLLHVDTGHNFPEVIAYRDARARESGLPLIVRTVEDSIRRGSVRLSGPNASRNAAQAVTLVEAQQEFEFDALIGGARRDEEKARAKERIFSHRDAFGAWRPRAQRPELWGLFNRHLGAGEHMRVFPMSNWTEADVWLYIAQEGIELPSLYFAHDRNVVRRDGLLFPVTALTPAGESDNVERLSVRFRTVGDVTCTCPVESDATNPEQVLVETLSASVSERGATRMDDRANAAAMERRKIEGYF